MVWFKIINTHFLLNIFQDNLLNFPWKSQLFRISSIIPLKIEISSIYWILIRFPRRNIERKSLTAFLNRIHFLVQNKIYALAVQRFIEIFPIEDLAPRNSYFFLHVSYAYVGGFYYESIKEEVKCNLKLISVCTLKNHIRLYIYCNWLYIYIQ